VGDEVSAGIAIEARERLCAAQNSEAVSGAVSRANELIALFGIDRLHPVIARREKEGGTWRIRVNCSLNVSSGWNRYCCRIRGASA
jgi:hypothetical protein